MNIAENFGLDICMRWLLFSAISIASFSISISLCVRFSMLFVSCVYVCALLHVLFVASFYYCVHFYFVVLELF